MKCFYNLLVCSVIMVASCREQVPMEHDVQHQHGQNQIYLTVREQHLAGIKTDTIVMGEITETKNVLGIVAVNANKTEYVSSRIKGRIEKLYIRSLNEFVRQGSPVAEIYSEELLADEQNYINVFQSTTPEGILLAGAARKRLELWGLTFQQILVLEKTMEPSPTHVLLSTTTGVVSGVFVTQGGYVEIGTRLLEVNDISSVWIEAQLYADEIAGVFNGASVTLTIADLPGQTFTAKAVFRTPVLEEQSKIYLVRYEVDNAAGELRPGMQANILLASESAAGLIVPGSSLVPGNEPSVWVELSAGLYEKRMVTIGVINSDIVEVRSGVKNGERVVSSGVYLLNSEFVLRNGADAMGGMVM